MTKKEYTADMLANAKGSVPRKTVVEALLQGGFKCTGEKSPGGSQVGGEYYTFDRRTGADRPNIRRFYIPFYNVIDKETARDVGRNIIRAAAPEAEHLSGEKLPDWVQNVLKSYKDKEDTDIEDVIEIERQGQYITLEAWDYPEYAFSVELPTMTRRMSRICVDSWRCILAPLPRVQEIIH